MHLVLLLLAYKATLLGGSEERGDEDHALGERTNQEDNPDAGTGLGEKAPIHASSDGLALVGVGCYVRSGHAAERQQFEEEQTHAQVSGRELVLEAKGRAYRVSLRQHAPAQVPPVQILSVLLVSHFVMLHAFHMHRLLVTLWRHHPLP